MDNSFLHSKKLLLVDDEPDLLKMVSDILQEAGFAHIIAAVSVTEAVSTAQMEKPDLIVLDVMLPDGDGFSLMQQLRTFTNVPVIFLTAKDEVADKLAGLGLGADDYIAKPFTPQELLLRIYVYCVEPIKKTIRLSYWMAVPSTLAVQKSTKATRASP